MNDKTNIDSLRILLVEDNPTDALLIKIALEQVRGVKITLTLVKRLDEALMRLQAEYFDAVLLDLGLPDSSGLETFTRTQSGYPNVPILILSGLDDETLALTAVREGAQDYLVKGKINSIMLARTIRYAVERKRTVEKLAASEMGYRRLFETAQDGIFILDFETGQVTDANPFLEDLLGYSTAEFIGKRLWEVGAFRDKAASEAAFQTLQEKSFIRYEDLPLSTKDGRLISVEFISNVYGVGDKQVIQCNIRDISERKQVEQELQASEARKSAILETALDCIIGIDAQSRILEWNPASEKTFGYAREEVMGKLLADLIIPESLRAAHFVGMEKYLATGEGPLLDQRIEFPALRKNGEEFPVELAITRNDSGGAPVFTAYLRDITQRKQAEDTLRASEELNHSILESSPDCIKLLDMDEGVISMNGPGLCLMEVDDFAMIEGQKWGGFWKGEAADLARAAVEAAKAGGSGRFQGYCPTLKGTPKWWDVTVTPILNEQRQPVRLVSNSRDITESKQAEQELQESNEKFQLLVNNIADTFWIRSPDMVEQYYLSPSFKRMWGIPLETQYSAPHIWSEFIVPEDRERVKAAFAMLMQDTPSISAEYRIKRPDEEVRWVHSRGYQVRNDAGELIRLAGIVSDITERKQAEEALHRQQSELRVLFDLMPAMIWFKDAENRILRINQRAAEAAGKSIEEIEGKPSLEIYPQEAAKFYADDLEVIHSAVPKLGIVEMLRDAEGEELWVQTDKVPVCDPDGKVIGIVVMAQNVTERTKVEEALRASEERFQNIVANVPGMVYQFILQPDGSIEMPFVSEGCRELYDLEPEEVQRNPNVVLDLVLLDDRAGFDRSILVSAQTLSPWIWQGRYQLPSGQTKWAQGASRPQRLPGGGTLWDGLLLDVTARKQAEEERDRFFTLSLDMLCIADNNGYFKRLNPAFEATLGHSNAELMEKPFLEWVHPDDREATLAVMQDLDAGAPTIDFVNRYRCSDGSYRWLSWTSTPFEGLVYAAAHDVTSLKNAEAALQKANDELELRVQERTAELSLAKAQADMANQAKSEFLSRMSHELRTPLNAILGFGQILERQDLTPRSSESVGYILKGGRHLLDLINEVLDIARVEAGRVDLSLEPISLADVIPEACALVRPLAMERHIRLDTRLEENVSEMGRYYILADIQRLKQVLINLLSNAIKYNREGGEVEIFWEQKRDGWISIAVRDTGPGISPQDMSKLFTPFERLSASTSTIEGTGLGLVLSQRLVTAMGGTLTAQSILGQGTTFTLELPQAAPPEEQVTNVPQNIQHADPDKKIERTYSVLCIEDNLSNLRLVEALFEDRPEITLLAAMQGSIGLDLARQHEPDLILLDLDLPDIHGSEVLARLQKSAITREIPVIVVSADATPTQIERLLEAGAKAYLTKPLDVGQFLNTIDTFLEASAKATSATNIQLKNPREIL